MAARAAEDFDAFYEARRAAAGEPSPDGSVVVLTFDGKGVVLHREDLREATRKAAERRRRQREQLYPFKRVQPGEKKDAKRMATVAAVYAVAPFVRSPEEFLRSLMPRQPVAKTKKAKTPAVRPRPVAKRVWASLEREPAEVIAEAMLEADRHDPGARQELGRARRRGRDAARSRRSGRRRLRRRRHGSPRHHPRGRVRLEGGGCVPPRGEPRAGVLGVDARARHSRGQGQPGGGVDAAGGDRRRPLARHPQAGRCVRGLPAEVRAVCTTTATSRRAIPSPPV